jgi:hypothetical protein
MMASDQLHLDGHEDFFKNHSSSNGFVGGVSLRDVNAPRPHRRSRSAGRSTGPKSRDIVQDVYDRMGMSYARGMPSIDLAAGNGGNLSAMDDRAPARGRSRGQNEGSGTDGAPTTAEKFQDRYKAAATRGRGRASQKLEAEPEEERRARSLSRGRMAARWPPNNLAPLVVPTNTNAEIQTPSLPEPASHLPATIDNMMSLQATKVPSYNFSTGQAPRLKNEPPIFVSQTGRGARPSYTVNSIQDEKKEEEPSPDLEVIKKEPPQRRPSIKDRINTYAGVAPAAASPARTVRRSYNAHIASPQQYSKRELPPQVDIYAAQKNHGAPSDEGAEVDDTTMTMNLTSKESSSPPSTVVTSNAFGDVPGPPLSSQQGGHNERFQNNSSAMSVGSRSSKGGGRLAVADAFMAAIGPGKPQTTSQAAPTSPRHSTTKGFSMVNIPSSDDVSSGLGVDVGSLAASSFSGDDFAASPTNKQRPRREVVAGIPQKPSFRNESFRSFFSLPVTAGKPALSSNHGTMTPAVSTNHASMTPEMMEKYVDQRIQSAIADVENKFEIQLRQLEDKYKGRIEYLEAKVEKLDRGAVAGSFRTLSGPSGKHYGMHY